MLIPFVCSQRVCLLHATECTAKPLHTHSHTHAHTQLSLTLLRTSHGAALCSMAVALDSKSSGAVRRAVSSTPADLGAALHGCCFCCEAHLALCIHALSCSAGGSSTAGTEVALVSCRRAAVPVAPLAIVALNRDFCPTLSINLLPTRLHWHPSELSAKPPGLPWSVSALSHASLQRRLIFPGTVSKTVQHMLPQARDHCSFEQNKSQEQGTHPAT